MEQHSTEAPKLQTDRKRLRKVYTQERRLEAIRSGLNAASFAYGRRNAIRDLMHDRCGGECETDDVETFFDLMLPFAVEAAYLHKGRDPLVDVAKFFGRVMPAFMRSACPEHITNRVREALEQRAAAPTAETYVDWLPRMESLVADLRVTRDEVQRLGLRGWGCIDPASPEERKEADRQRKRAERAAKGATPRQMSITGTQPWKALGISRATWYRHKREGTLDTLKRETETSAPWVYTLYGADESVSLPEPFMIAAAGFETHARQA